MNLNDEMQEVDTRHFIGKTHRVLAVRDDVAADLSQKLDDEKTLRSYETSSVTESHLAPVDKGFGAWSFVRFVFSLSTKDVGI